MGSTAHTAAEALRALVREVVREELRAAHIDLGAPFYTTAPGGVLPPGRSRRWLREHAPHIPGATRSGGVSGRSVVWSVSREDYERWLAARTKRVTAAPEPEPEHAAPVVDLDGWIASAGYRATRKARGQ